MALILTNQGHLGVEVPGFEPGAFWSRTKQKWPDFNDIYSRVDNTYTITICYLGCLESICYGRH